MKKGYLDLGINLSSKSDHLSTHIEVGYLRLDTTQKAAILNGKSLPLSPTAFSLLSFLMTRSPTVISVDQILSHVWKDKIVNRDTVKQQIKLLREQLGEAGEYIQSVRGHGYQIVQPNHYSSNPDNNNQPSSTLSWSKLLNSTRVFSRLDNKKWLLAGLFLFSLAAIMVGTLMSRSTSISVPIKVVILPFEHIGQVESTLPRIMQDELVTRLSRNRNARVVAISVTNNTINDVFTHKDYSEELNVDLIFEGVVYEQNLRSEKSTIEKSKPKNYRVNIRAIWTHDGTTVWRDNILVKTNDIHEIINQVSVKATKFLKKKTDYYSRNT